MHEDGAPARATGPAAGGTSSRRPARSTRSRSSGPNAYGSSSAIGSGRRQRLDQALRAAVLPQQLAAAAARHQRRRRSRRTQDEGDQPAAAGGVQRRRPGRTRRTAPTPYEAFSTLQPDDDPAVVDQRRPRPTGKSEYGAYACRIASTAAARSAAQSISMP